MWLDLLLFWARRPHLTGEPKLRFAVNVLFGTPFILFKWALLYKNIDCAGAKMTLFTISLT